jgi:hypothetical protein
LPAAKPVNRTASLARTEKSDRFEPSEEREIESDD